MPVIKGTASVADSRALSKALKSTRFPDSFKTAVEISKVNRDVLTQWIEKKVAAALGFEDEIVELTAVNTFLPTSPEDGSAMEAVDPRIAQTTMAGFMGEEKAAEFAQELWELMIDAQSAPMGIPRKLLDEKKKELAAQASAPHRPRAPPAAAPQRQRPPRRHQDDRNRHHRPVSPPHRRPENDRRGRDRSYERRSYRDDRYSSGNNNNYNDRHPDRRYYDDRDDRRYRRSRSPPDRYANPEYHRRGHRYDRDEGRASWEEDRYGRRRRSRKRSASRSRSYSPSRGRRERPRGRYSSDSSSASSRSASPARR